MKIRTLALALALSCGGIVVLQAAGQKPVVHKVKRSKKYKQSKASQVKPRKAKKHSHKP